MPDSGSSSRELRARGALLEITGADTIGDLVDATVGPDEVVTVRFAALLAGYPGWHWSVSLAELPGEEPTVLEAELMPGEGALLAPDWVPWSDRLGEEGDADSEDADEDEDDDLDPDEVDDGIDFETDNDPDDPDDPREIVVPDDRDPDGSALAAPVGVEQHDEPEAETDDGRPEPPRLAALKKRWQRKKKSAEGE